MTQILFLILDFKKSGGKFSRRWKLCWNFFWK